MSTTSVNVPTHRSAPARAPSGHSGWLVPFHDTRVEEAAIARVVSVLRSGWLTTGPECRAFEQEFATTLGGDVDAIAVTSGTAALHLALDAVGVRAGDLVVTSPYTFTATAEVTRYLGADPLFADIDPVTGNLTADAVVAAVDRLPRADRRRVRAVLPVHFAGLPCDLTALRVLCEDRGWALVDDAAHALPAAHRGAPVGTGTDVTAFSFYATKTLSTGEGGMLVTADDRIAARARTMRLHGIDRDVFDRYALRDRWYYEVAEAGFKYNLTDIAAGLGRAHLPLVEEHRARRDAVARTYTLALAEVPGLALPPKAADGDVHAWHLYALRITEGREVRDRFIRELAALGIGASVHFIPLHLQPYYRDRYGLRPADFPHATALFDQEVSLPIFPHLTGVQVRAVVEAVPEALARARLIT